MYPTRQPFCNQANPAYPTCTMLENMSTGISYQEVSDFGPTSIMGNILTCIKPNTGIGMLSEKVFVPTCVYPIGTFGHRMDCINVLTYTVCI